MVKNEFTFLSADGKTPIHGIEWLPEDTPRAVLQISHGVAEYIARYEPLAKYLTEQGFAVVGNDHIGHGLSVAKDAEMLYFQRWDDVVDDLDQVRCRIGKEFPSLPCFLLGHSMGSFLARTYLIRYPGAVSGAIIMGTGQMSPAMTAGGRVVAAVEAKKVGWEHASPVVEKLAFGAYNKIFAPNRTGYDWLSVNEENVDRYIADPLCGGNASVGLFREMLHGLDFIRSTANLRKMNLNTPVLFVSGSMDPVGDCGKSVQKAYESFRKVGVRDVRLKLYPGARHEILNDNCRETVYQDLAAWMAEKLPQRQAAAV
ncbi:MAG: alpha/beta hydrolase [Oscillibacter sp.]|jgi:alpha-beta hydrolase superfamily lysophospholipase|nr:alpha/beta hydrolase [Oscillibacter sp.]